MLQALGQTHPCGAPCGSRGLWGEEYQPLDLDLGADTAGTCSCPEPQPQPLTQDLLGRRGQTSLGFWPKPELTSSAVALAPPAPASLNCLHSPFRREGSRTPWQD